MQELAVDDSTKTPTPPNESGAKARVILKFFALWIGSLVILVVLALLTNIEWARRHIATALCQSFHRTVTLGRLSWSFGLQGLSIDTDHFEMRDRDGGPFIVSGPSEIGIAFLPLIQQKLVIKHLQFKKPEVWAVKFTDKVWNFSDLVTEGPEIHMVQIENGTLHLRNRIGSKIGGQATPVAFSTLPRSIAGVPIKKYKNESGRDARAPGENADFAIPQDGSEVRATKAGEPPALPGEPQKLAVDQKESSNRYFFRAEKVRAEEVAIEEQKAKAKLKLEAAAKERKAKGAPQALHMLPKELANQVAQTDKLPAIGSEHWSEYTVRDIKLSMTFPKGNRNWPLYLACKIPVANTDVKDKKDGANYDTGIVLSATGSGPYSEWKKNKYKVDLNLSKFDPSKFRGFIPEIPPVSGVSNMQIKGEGSFNEGFFATASGTVDNLVVPTSKNKELELDHTRISSNILIDPKNIEWKDLKVLLGNWELESNGRLVNWQQKAKNTYEARVGGKLNDLSGFFHKVVASFVPEAEYQAHADKKLPGVRVDKGAKLAGSATIELQLAGKEGNHNISTNIKANGVPLADLIEGSNGGHFLESFHLDPSAPITGEVSIDQKKRVVLKNIEIPMDDSKVKLSGFVDDVKKDAEIEFKADNLDYETFKKRIGPNNDIFKAISGGKGSYKPLQISGRLDLKGKYKSIDGKQSLAVDSNLKNITVKSENGMSITSMNGKIGYDGDTVTVRQLTGKLPPGSNKIAGSINVAGKFETLKPEHFELDFQANDVLVSQMKDWLNRFGLKLQQPYADRLSGEMREIKAQVSGNTAHYNLNFSINPTDLVMLLPGRTGEGQQQFRFSSGSMTYKDRELAMKDVVVQSRGGKMTVTGSMSGQLEALKFKNARFRSEGFELADLQGILHSSAPPSSSKAKSKRAASTLPDFLVPTNASSLHGKVYGDMQFNYVNNDMNVDGVVGFHNAGGKFGTAAVQVEKLTGLAAISKSQIVLQDTSGQIGLSTFSADGVITNYKSPNYTWEGQLRGRFFPAEVERLMDQLGHGIELGSTANDALGLRVSGTGDREKADLRFSGRAKKGQGLHLKTAFGTFTQPKGHPLFFNGSMNVNEVISQLVLSDFNLISGEDSQHGDLLRGNGQFQWATEQAERPASLAFALNTPQPIKLSTIAEIVSQKAAKTGTTQTEIGGSTQVNLKVEGPVSDLVMNGTFALEKVSLPGIHMDNLTGKIDLPNWHLNQNDKDASASSLAKLTVNTMSFGGLNIRDASATLSLDSEKGIVMKDGQANIAGGKLTMKGSFNPQDQTNHTEINISKLVVDQFVKDVMDHSGGGLSGLADISMTLDGKGSPLAIPGSKQSSEPWIKNVTGSGKFNIYQGSVANLGKLQEKLNAGNLLQQGLFGFNVNNLLQAMMPVNSGQFNEISGKITLDDGNINFEQVFFDGNDLRLRAAGKLDVVSRKLDFDVAGDIPRVSSSIIPGAFGEMSRKITLQKMFRIVTFKKLKDLPALPILGDIANDDPRAFRFDVGAPTDNQKLITSSVEKSFKWLPNRPLASPHPVPGM